MTNRSQCEAILATSLHIHLTTGSRICASNSSGGPNKASTQTTTKPDFERTERPLRINLHLSTQLTQPQAPWNRQRLPNDRLTSPYPYRRPFHSTVNGTIKWLDRVGRGTAYYHHETFSTITLLTLRTVDTSGLPVLYTRRRLLVSALSPAR
jgi:hypothetical protein